jgi:hypothetical protein
MGKAIQCPTCGRKHRVGALPDAPSFHCEGCGKSLKVPAQFRPSVMASSRHISRDEAGARASSTSVLPKSAPPAPAAAARSAPAVPRAPKSTRRAAETAAKTRPQPAAALLRVLAWAVALVLGLLITGWIARVSGWLSGDRLVDVFTGTGGMERYLRVLALAPAWAVVTTLLLTLFLEGRRALARRRDSVRAERSESRRRQRRTQPEPVDASLDDPVDASLDDPVRDGAFGDGQGRRRAARRGSR